MTEFNSKIFKPYDIRGIYPSDLNEEVTYLIGRAFAKKSKATKILVGTDGRVSGPSLKKELIRGIIDEGINVIDIGLIPIDAVYAGVGKFGYEAGIMITASHNPAEYNGFKMVLKDMKWVRGVEMIDDVSALSDNLSGKKGIVSQKDIMPQYIKHVLSFTDTTKIKPFTVIVDAGSGLAGKVIPLLEEHLPIKVIPLNFEIDGNFPAHPSNPLLPESQILVKEAVAKHKADFGVIFDGDTDRLIFIDENSQEIKADMALLILAKEFLNREPGKGIVYNVICSKSVREKVAEWGGIPIRSRVGYVFISQAMRENDGIMGGELSSHYAFRDNAYSDSGFIAFLIMLQLLSQDGRPLSEIIKDFNKYAKADEVNLEVEDREKVIAEIKKEYSDGQQDELDGLTVEYDNWWFNVRPSNTEPLLRVTVEADTQDLLKEKGDKLIDFVNQVK